MTTHHTLVSNICVLCEGDEWIEIADWIANQAKATFLIQQASRWLSWLPGKVTVPHTKTRFLTHAPE
jgi:hypothetical protein